METGGDWQILSVAISEIVIAAHRRVTKQVTTAGNAAENEGFLPRRTSDFRYLGLWHLECDSTAELVIQPEQSNGDEENFKCGNRRVSH
jgi:hypothetical protein